MPRNPGIRISGDARKSPGAAHEIAVLRGHLIATAEATPMPDRFSAIPHPDRPAMIVCDEDTGRSAAVALHAYGELRQALHALFG